MENKSSKMIYEKSNQQVNKILYIAFTKLTMHGAILNRIWEAKHLNCQLLPGKNTLAIKLSIIEKCFFRRFPFDWRNPLG